MGRPGCAETCPPAQPGEVWRQIERLRNAWAVFAEEPNESLIHAELDGALLWRDEVATSELAPHLPHVRGVVSERIPQLSRRAARAEAADELCVGDTPRPGGVSPAVEPREYLAHRDTSPTPGCLFGTTR